MVDYIAFFKAHDDPVYSEEPPSFDRDAAEARFTKMATAIVREFPGSRFETGVEIQDASFHGQVFVTSSGKSALIRVSNFGGFVTFFGGDYDGLGTDTRDKLLVTFAEIGYTFIPPDVLLAPYDGECRGVSGFRDWRYRFFEWI
jgi:hypothetical protein